MLGVGLALVAAAPAQGQERDQSPFANPEDPSAVRMMSAFEALQKALDSLEPQAEAIRADATLSGTIRRERLLKLLSQEEDRLRDVEAALAAVVRRHLEQEHATPEQILLAIEINRQHIMTGIVERFVTGQDSHAPQPYKPD